MVLAIRRPSNIVIPGILHKYITRISVLSKILQLSSVIINKVFNTSASVFSYCFRPRSNIETLINYYLFIS